MASRKKERRRARVGALSVLYSGDLTERSASSIVSGGEYPDGEIALSDYAEQLIAGVEEHRDDIDSRLASTSENWALDRMPVVDRSILRLAVYEMVHVDDVPVSVAINEAVELAKIYGGEDDSSRFVNGVLGRIARAMEPEAADAAASEEGGPAAEGAVGSDLADACD